MAVIGTTTLTNSIRALYTQDYLEAAMAMRLYDQLAAPVPGPSMAEMIKASAVNVPFLSDMTPGTAAISQSVDVTPQALVDAVAAITPTSRGEALKVSEQMLIQAYTNYGSNMSKVLGKNMMESVDLLALEQAVTGQAVNRYAARASLDAGTAAHRLSESVFSELHSELLSLKVPGFVNDKGEANTWMVIMHPTLLHDLRTNSSGSIKALGEYQQGGIHLAYELAALGPFRIIPHAGAKVFYAAGAANGTACSTTLVSEAAALSKTIVLTSATGATNGKWLTIGSVETGSTLYPTTERVKVDSVSGTVATIRGEGANGGLRFTHAAGSAVSNADSVYTAVFGGPASLLKLFAPDVGEFGKLVGPNVDGILEQFTEYGWKFYGGYGRPNESRVVRGEYSASVENV